MKKLVFTAAALIMVCTMAFAQDLTSKKGFAILPEQGDIAIGIDATPVFDLVGNIVKINSGAAFANPLQWNFISGQTIIGKYFTDANTAYRGKIRIGKSSTTDKEYSMQDGQADPLVTVEDKEVTSTTNIVLGGGLEKHRGKGRLQGIYGAEALIMLTGGGTKYTYGNDFNTNNAGVVAQTNFGTNIIGASRVTSAKGGGTFGIQARAFVGVEYFFAPKVSFGGEFGWGLGFGSMSDTKTTTETWDGVNNVKKTTENIGGGGGGLLIDTDNAAGSIYLMFHF